MFILEDVSWDDLFQRVFLSDPMHLPCVFMHTFEKYLHPHEGRWDLEGFLNPEHRASG